AKRPRSDRAGGEDEGGVGARLAERLQSAGRRVVRVRPGPMLEHRGADEWTLRPGSAEDFQTLVEGLERAESGHFVHLWSLDPQEAAAAADVLGRERARGADTLLALAGALAARGSGSARVTVATAGVHDVSGEEALLPARASAAAAVAAVREAGVAARHLDFGTDGGPRAAARKAEQLLPELLAEGDADAVAYRGRLRFVRGWEAPAAEEGVAPATLKADGVYLLTGGLTPPGLALAGALAGPGARLALLGGLPVPPREMWQMVIDACAHAAGPIDQVRALEEAGAEVAFSSADPRELGALRIFAATVRARWGRIDGVIHCAAAAGEGDGRHAGPASSAEPVDVLAAAAAGANALRAVFRDEPLDFCLLLSGHDAGGAAAEAYLDAFCAAQARESAVPWISARMAPIRTSPDGEGVDPAAFVDTLRAILAAPAPQVVVSDSEPAAPARRAAVEGTAVEEAAVEDAASHEPEADEVQSPGVAAAAPSAAPQAAAPAAPGAADARNVLTTYAPPANDVQTHVAGVWQELLGVGQVGIHDDFFELGGHSLLGIRVLSRLRTELAVDLPPEVLFMAPTVAQLSEVVEAVMAEELDGMSDEELRALAEA
ncbi:MAG: KR domain-containing protein, partial [Gemmatimonadetes bacterium]|nr:KR domain-containing protein [Gemmatimonadota bacterium]